MPESPPTFYVVLPASVRYAPNLSDFQKLLWAEIAALSHKHGYCHAKNAYFAQVFGKSLSTVKRAIVGLISDGLVTELPTGNKQRRLHAASSDEFRYRKRVIGDPVPAHG